MADGLMFPKNPSKKRRMKHKASILQEKDGRCYLCMKLHNDYSFKFTQEHHVYFGRGQREISEAEGFKVHLCLDHHEYTGGPEAVHKNHETSLLIQQDMQRKYEETHTRAEFMRLIGRSYI